MTYYLELRRDGVPIAKFETTEKRAAKEQACQWLSATREAAVVLWIDGEEVKLGKIPEALGLKGREYDALSRYVHIPLPSGQRVFSRRRKSRKMTYKA